jgi:hypothetical protein
MESASRACSPAKGCEQTFGPSSRGCSGAGASDVLISNWWCERTAMQGVRFGVASGRWNGGRPQEEFARPRPGGFSDASGSTAEDTDGPGLPFRADRDVGWVAVGSQKRAETRLGLEIRPSEKAAADFQRSEIPVMIANSSGSFHRIACARSPVQRTAPGYVRIIPRSRMGLKSREPSFAFVEPMRQPALRSSATLAESRL